MTTTVCNIRKKELNKNGYKDLEDWKKKSNHLYIGRNLNFYVKGAIGSKWKNPFSVKKYGRDKELYNCLEELVGKVLGCWCYPEPCHGDILIKLLDDKIKNE